MCQMCCLKKEQMETCKHKNTMRLRSIKSNSVWPQPTSLRWTVLNGSTLQNDYLRICVSVDCEDAVPQTTGCLSSCIIIMFQWFSALHRLNLLRLRRVGVEAEISLTEPQQTKPKTVCTAGYDPATWCNVVISCRSRKWEMRNTCWLKEHELNVSSLL